jgi:hypothetical protein
MIAGYLIQRSASSAGSRARESHFIPSVDRHFSFGSVHAESSTYPTPYPVDTDLKQSVGEDADIQWSPSSVNTKEDWYYTSIPVYVIFRHFRKIVKSVC